MSSRDTLFDKFMNVMLVILAVLITVMTLLAIAIFTAAFLAIIGVTEWQAYLVSYLS